MTSQANHVTQNVARTKLAQYLTLVKVSSGSVNEISSEQNWVERKINVKEKKEKFETQ